MPPIPLVMELVASGSTGIVGSPADVTHAPGDYTRLFVVVKSGLVLIANPKNGTVLNAPFLDIKSLVSLASEQGMLGLAFHPNYQSNGYFFVNYTNLAGETVVARYQRAANNPDLANPASGVTLLQLSQPYPNHNGGQIRFGPDGHLYVGLGDGGLGGDPSCYAQRWDDPQFKFLGKMLRLDVNQNVNTPPYYGIPAGNPFGGPGEPPAEVWALGLRNPWRFSFDRLTGDLYIADVGQEQREEVNLQSSASAGGENYGWKMMEGELCFDPAPLDVDCPVSTQECFDVDLADPIRVLDQTDGYCAIIGGYVYRGCAIPQLSGYYIFSDFCTAEVLAFNDIGGLLNAIENWTPFISVPPPNTLTRPHTWGEDARGELYLADRDGEIYRLAPASGGPSIADIDCDGQVGVQDFLDVLLNWGPCDGCREDMDGDHLVGITEFLMVLSQWG